MVSDLCSAMENEHERRRRVEKLAIGQQKQVSK